MRISPSFNRAIAGNTYSPGSTFKIIDAVAALESGKYNAESVIANPAQLPLPGTNISLPNYTGGQCSTRTRQRLSGRWRSPVTPVRADCDGPWVRSVSLRPPRTSYGQDLKIPLTVSKSSFPSNMTQSQLASRPSVSTT